MSSAALATVLSDDLRAMPPALLEKTFHLIAAGPVPASITAIAKEVLMSMYISKLTGTAALVLLTGMFGALAAALALPAPVEERSQDKKPPLQRPAAPAEAAGKKDGDALQGAWEAQSAEQDGKALPEAEIKKMRVSIKGDLMLMLPGGEWTRLRIKLDPAKTPKVMYATPIEGDEKDKTVPLIYRLDTAADTLTLCFDAKNGKTAPAEFAAREGSGLMLLVVKREARAPAAAKE